MFENGLVRLLEQDWEQLLDHPAVGHGLSEDLSEPDGQRIFNFGFVGFVCDSRLRDYLRNPTPLCGEAAIRGISAGSAKPLLTSREVKTLNSAGRLQAIDLFCACRPERVYGSLDMLQSALDAYLHAIKGFGISEVLMDAAGKQERDVFLGAGSTRVRSVLEDWFPSATDLKHRGDDPIIVGLTRAEANEPFHKTAFSAQIFRQHAIRYAFSELAATIYQACTELSVRRGTTTSSKQGSTKNLGTSPPTKPEEPKTRNKGRRYWRTLG